MSNLVRINEFSRQFTDPRWSDRLNKYVCDGFRKEIGFQTADVPPEIQEAIYKNKFRINDNYPLELGETALIAREMGQYSVLAVITYVNDDAMRSIACYRYFWLINIAIPSFDGIGTLLKWWEEKGKPYCEVKPWSEYEKEIEQNGEDYYQATSIDQQYSERFQKQNEAYKQQTNKDLDADQIDEKPYIFSIHKEGDKNLPNYWGVHDLALQLNDKYQNAPLAWSWNTSIIDQLVYFSLVCCADEKNYELQKKWNSSAEKFVIENSEEQMSVSENISETSTSSDETIPLNPVDVENSSLRGQGNGEQGTGDRYFQFSQNFDPQVGRGLKTNPGVKETLDNVQSDVEQNELNELPTTSSPNPFFKRILLGLLILGIGAGGVFLVNRFLLNPNPTIEESEPSP